MFARIISELCAPWILNIVFFLILGGTINAWQPGIVAALGTGVVPMMLILGLMKLGRVGNHHVTTRSQRGIVFAGIIICVIALLLVLRTLETPQIIWAGVFSALVFLALFAAVTVKIKASVHVGLWVCLVTFLGLTISAWWFVGLFFTPVTAWARMRIKHHTLPEICAGAVSGAVATVLCYLFILT
ncbi:phosphoesterase [Corynebacterium crudilactis]|uniref:Phosphoesterase n=2 Tax=Corynebacterium crudilactis TaxID=1652495 RepID=A0A172QXJ6_9CORY|nr:phosphoesterase [Corynebacterium crudilactis]